MSELFRVASVDSWLLETLDTKTGEPIASTVKPDFRMVIAAVILAESLPPGEPVRFEIMADMSAASDAEATGKLIFHGKKAVYEADLLPVDDPRQLRNTPGLFGDR